MRKDGSTEAEKTLPALDIVNDIAIEAVSTRLQKVPNPSFRAARVVRDKTPTPTHLASLYAVMNTAPDRGERSGTRMSFVCMFFEREGEEKESIWSLGRIRSISSKAITVFDVNAAGTLLAYGSSDLSIGILDAKTLGPLMEILNAHEFPSTVLRFNPSSTLLISGSADNSIRVVEVPEGLEKGSGMTTIIYALVALLVAILALFLAQRRFT